MGCSLILTAVKKRINAPVKREERKKEHAALYPWGKVNFTIYIPPPTKASFGLRGLFERVCEMSAGKGITVAVLTVSDRVSIGQSMDQRFLIVCLSKIKLKKYISGPSIVSTLQAFISNFNLVAQGFYSSFLRIERSGDLMMCFLK